MLRTRILTAAVAVPLAVAAILWLPVEGLAMLVAVLMLLAAWEWAGLTGSTRAGRAGFVIAVALLMTGVLGLQGVFADARPASALVAFAAIFWLAAVRWIRKFPQGFAQSLGRPRVARIAGAVILVAPVVAVVDLRGLDHGAGLILLLCVLIWGADTGAYAAGRLLGRRKLVPNVSPGKTIAGALGGLLVAVLAGGLGALALGYGGAVTLAFMALGIWVAALSIVGDLTVSMFKRSAGVKDSGRLFPGHGGVLDRLDSLLAAAPWFLIGLQMVGWAA